MTHPDKTTACNEDRVGLARWWIVQLRDQLVAMGKLPSGYLGDWAFILRDQLTDILDRPASPLTPDQPPNPECGPVDVRETLEQAKDALIKIRTCSIAGFEEGYGKPEKWADDLFRSHGDVAAALKTIDAALASLPPASGRDLA